MLRRAVSTPAHLRALRCGGHHIRPHASGRGSTLSSPPPLPVDDEPSPEPVWWTMAGRLLHRKALASRSEVGYTRSLLTTIAQLVWSGESAFGNGAVAVTRHGPWLALRFDSSEQGLSFAGLLGDPDYAGGAALPGVLSFEYTRTSAFS